jgi:hypothetical protein
MYKCNGCNTDFAISAEHWFHVNIECVNRTKSCFHIGSSGPAPAKKYSNCYRCGRQGHYYLDKECYATTDIDGNLITWGIKCKSSETFVNRRNYRT